MEMYQISNQNLTSWIYKRKIYKPYQPRVPNLFGGEQGNKKTKTHHDVVLDRPRITTEIEDAEGQGRLETRDFEPSLKDWWDGGQAEIEATVLCWIAPQFLYDKYDFYHLQFFHSGYIGYIEIVCKTYGKDSRMSYTACCV